MPNIAPKSWTIIAHDSLRDEATLVATLIAEAGLDATDRDRITTAGADLVRRIRESVKPGLMEVFLAEYGLSTEEGIALMCLAEALLRVPDATKAFEGMRARGVLVKNVSKMHELLANCLRLTVGTADENTRMLAALEASL